MSTVRLQAVATNARQEIPMQPASQDIWDNNKNGSKNGSRDTFHGAQKKVP